MYLRRALTIFFLLLASGASQAQVTLSRDLGMSVDVASDGRMAIDLKGDIWVIPGGGGDASRITRNLRSAQRPRWSPDDSQLVFEATIDGRQGLWLYDLDTEQRSFLSEESRIDRHPAWHPAGERITYASARNGFGFDLWETDVATGLHWRVSHRPGDETEPNWSADGRNLVYVYREGNTWSLVLRRFNGIEEVLVRSPEKISSPSWRPDGSLVMWMQHSDTGVSLNMVILSEPRLVRVYENAEGIDPVPVSWLNRHRMLYVANGYLRKRQFNAWSSSQVRFRARIEPEPIPVVERTRAALPWVDEPTGELVIHAARLFDGIGFDYQYDKDILIEGGRITAIEDHAERPGKIVIDMGDLAVLPGYIDADARLPADLSASHGPDLLSMGVTTVAANHPNAEKLTETWSGKAIPGPRLLSGAAWQIGPQPRAELNVTGAVSSSRETGRPAGVALPNQFRAMELAGLSPLQTLKSIGVNAAAAMLADPYLGRIAKGAAADLVLVDGDPLGDVSDSLNVVAVVRNGRFFSVSGLFDRAKSAESVE